LLKSGGKGKGEETFKEKRKQRDENYDTTEKKGKKKFENGR